MRIPCQCSLACDFSLWFGSFGLDLSTENHHLSQQITYIGQRGQSEVSSLMGAGIKHSTVMGCLLGVGQPGRKQQPTPPAAKQRPCNLITSPSWPPRLGGGALKGYRASASTHPTPPHPHHAGPQIRGGSGHLAAPAH